MDFGAKAANYVKIVLEAFNWSNADLLYARYSKA
jgi:Fe-Mn family superoxide dismutase